MLDLPPATVNDFLATFKGLMDQAARQAPPEEEPADLPADTVPVEHHGGVV